VTLSAGTRLGPYEITGPLGEGGMGVVYRATDSKLKREVAIKVLPEAFAADAERLARFEREAQLLAQLQHANIASIYGLEESNGVRALVMELAPGEDLAERLKRGPLPLDEALAIARQIAEALEEAHEKGIVHRDLKPANVKVTPDGKVKILDFGLAKAMDAPGTSSAVDLEHSPTLMNSPTMTAAGSRIGVILGTASYMSPEQARGKSVDRRADIWAFGVVLYEMLAGRRLFDGETVSDVLASVLTREPNLGALPAATPPAVRQLVRRCLDRDPRHRLRDIGEARVLLEAPGAGAPPPAESRRPRSPWALAALGAALLVAGAIGGALVGRGVPAAGNDEVRVFPLTFRRGTVLSGRFAPDGETVVYGAAWDGEPLDVFSVRLDTRESRSIGVPGADVLAVSSAGELALALGHRFTIGWESTGTLARMPLGGGSPREVLERVQNADWSPDGRDLAVVRDDGALRRLEFPIGKALYATGGWISHVRVARDGKSVAFLDHASRGDNNASVKVADLSGTVRTVYPGTSNGLAWSASGRELFFPGAGGLRAADLSGRSRAVLRSLGGIHLQDVSTAGHLLVNRTTMQREIVAHAPGSSRGRNLSWLDWSFPTALSDDGRFVLFEEQNLGREYGLFLRNTDGTPPVRLGDGRALALSPDGKWVVATQREEGARELILLPTGAGEIRRLGRLDLVASAASFLPGGERLVLSGYVAGGGTRLYTFDLAARKLEPISPEGITAYFAALASPDGRRAFATGPDGKLTLYPIGEGEPLVVPGTASEDVPIRWTEDGRAIFVRSASGVPAKVERVDVTTGERQPWLELVPPDPAGVQGIGPVHLSADGRSYVYSYRRKLDQLYIARGLR
jgi:tRNA A-37 threonylcarbamoyl transferase component Bud32/Tol biopolymer transport system component